MSKVYLALQPLTCFITFNPHESPLETVLCLPSCPLCREGTCPKPPTAAKCPHFLVCPGRTRVRPTVPAKLLLARPFTLKGDQVRQ